jgi:hypothetical protein
LEILACPHCLRLFQTTPAVLGKKIRCRGCLQVFNVPKDTTGVPLGPAVHAAADLGGDPPLAIGCIKNGQDARCCPKCGREFLMKPAFVGKTIRCRGCKVPFRVAASERPIEKSVQAADKQAPEAQPRPPASSPPRLQPTENPKPVPALPSRSPTIFEDIGDILEDIRAGERVASVVRPTNAAALAKPEYEALATLIAIVLGGACALPAVQLILWWAFDQDPLLVGKALPDFLEWIAPPRWRN